jgi:hypothetical protein
VKNLLAHVEIRQDYEPGPTYHSIHGPVRRCMGRVESKLSIEIDVTPETVEKLVRGFQLKGGRMLRLPELVAILVSEME